MKRAIILAVLPLAACNQGPSVSATNASSEEVAAKVEAAGGGQALMSPGQWQSTVAISDVKVPGMPAAAAEQVKASMAKTQNFTTCLTAEDAKQPKGNFFGGDQGGQCKYDHFTMSGGKIDAVQTCTVAGTQRKMTMTGNYSPDSYKIAVTSAGQGGGGNPMGNMEMTMTMEGKRTGECAAPKAG
ncbi:DUF3617 domain-containing protein [Sphingomonas sp. DT-204]|uniref:DUF3617 domain-containing protein n=1 Tax=Sphingomonas sp. DT-204 TaxID=3396166 RepID=UPI003F1937F7